MNMYDDAIILIHHRRHLNGGEHNAYDDEIEQALERAKKEHELLALYKLQKSELPYTRKWNEIELEIKKMEMV